MGAEEVALIIPRLPSVFTLCLLVFDGVLPLRCASAAPAARVS